MNRKQLEIELQEVLAINESLCSKVKILERDLEFEKKKTTIQMWPADPLGLVTLGASCATTKEMLKTVAHMMESKLYEMRYKIASDLLQNHQELFKVKKREVGEIVYFDVELRVDKNGCEESCEESRDDHAVRSRSDSGYGTDVRGRGGLMPCADEWIERMS